MCCATSAYLARLAGDLDQARILLDEAVSIFRALGDRDGESMALNHLGCLHRVRAEFAEGRDTLEHSLRHPARNRRPARDRPDARQPRRARRPPKEIWSAGSRCLEQALAGFRETEDVPGRVGFTLDHRQASMRMRATTTRPAPATRRLAGVAAHPRQPPRDRVGICHAQRGTQPPGQADEAVRALARGRRPVPGARRDRPGPSNRAKRALSRCEGRVHNVALGIARRAK